MVEKNVNSGKFLVIFNFFFLVFSFFQILLSINLNLRTLINQSILLSECHRSSDQILLIPGYC